MKSEFSQSATYQKDQLMSQGKIKFEDASGYDQMMGFWSQLVGDKFLKWLAPKKGQRWLDIGCGGGAFTEQLMLSCAPSYLAGVDPSEDQLAFAQKRPSLRTAEFRKSDAMELPFEENEFDAATMALVLFFVPEPRRGVAEMLRVTRPGASISAYVWDIHNGGFPPEPIKAQLQKMGVELPLPPSSDISKMTKLRSLWTEFQLSDIETEVIKVPRRFDNFDDFWSITTNSASIKMALSNLPTNLLADLREAVQNELPSNADGSITYTAFANAIKGNASK